MRESRRSLHYGGLSVKNELRQVHLYLVALITFFIIEHNFGGVADFLAEGMDRIGVGKDDSFSQPQQGGYCRAV